MPSSSVVTASGWMGSTSPRLSVKGLTARGGCVEQYRRANSPRGPSSSNIKSHRWPPTLPKEHILVRIDLACACHIPCTFWFPGHDSCARRRSSSGPESMPPSTSIPWHIKSSASDWSAVLWDLWAIALGLMLRNRIVPRRSSGGSVRDRARPALSVELDPVYAHDPAPGQVSSAPFHAGKCPLDRGPFHPSAKGPDLSFLGLPPSRGTGFARLSDLHGLSSEPWPSRD